MFPDVNELLDISEGQVQSGKCLFVSESKTDGGVFLHHMVSLYMKSKLRVCLVAFANSFGHYNNIGNKLGNSLNKSKDCGDLVFIDAMKMLSEWLKNENSANNFDLKELFKNVEETIKSQSPKSPDSKPTLIVIDDTSIPLNLGIRLQQIILFVMYMRQLALQSGNCLLVLQRCDEDAEDEDGQLLKRQTAHFSDTIIRVRGLKSGYSKDVHGEVEVVQRNVEQSEPQDSSKRVMQYKLTDKSIQLFAKGTSAAVL